MALQNPRIVVLEACHCPVLPFDFPNEYTEYANTSNSQVLERIKDADIVITTIVQIPIEVAAQCPRLKLIAIMATAAGWVDKDYFAGRGITVINCPQSNIPAVTEHAIGLYFACRKRTVQLHNGTVHTNMWVEQGTMTTLFPRPPRTCTQETVGIIGYGALGKRIEELCKGIGMGQVNISERRGASPRIGRLHFEEILRTSTVLIICCPKDASTINLIDLEELKTMPKDAVLINMARGGIVNEKALAQALREGLIESAATDVLEVEPPDGNCPLLPRGKPIENLTISPHISWYSATTITTLQNQLKNGVEAYMAGKPIYVVV